MIFFRSRECVGYIGYELSRSRVATNMCTYRHAVTRHVALNLYPFALYRAPSACCSQYHVTSDSPNAGVVFVVRCPYARPLSIVHCPLSVCSHFWSPIYISITIVLALCFTSNKPLLQVYQTVTNLRFEVPLRSILCIPQKSPLTL